jgi:phosphate transport system substrate-binding protein
VPRTRLLGVAAATVALAAVPSTALAKTTITMSGSTSINPLAGSLAKGYISKCGSCVSFRLSQGGSDIGIADVARGRVSIGNASRDPQPSDPGGLVFNRIARDGVCIITNPGNRIANLATATVQAIFTGRTRTWQDVPGSSRTGTIDLITRTPSSGTQDAFQNIFLGQSLRPSSSASQKQSNGLVQQSVRSNPNAIGYVSFDFSKGVNAVPYRGVACNLRNAKSGQYGGVRNFWMVTRGAPSGDTKKFLDYVKSSAGQRIVASNWVPIR